MSTLQKFTSTALFSLLALALPFAFAQAQEESTIVDIAVGNPNFSSLVDAVSSQGLVDTLASEGPFTVFAPTNDAFEGIPSFIGRALEAKPELLTDILLYHVVADDLDSQAVLSSRTIRSVEGSRLMPNLQNGDPYINNAMITAVDIDASNGTIHVIDEVLVPRGVIVEAFRIELQRLQQEFRALLNELRTF